MAPKQPISVVATITQQVTNTDRVALRCAEILPRHINIFYVACIETTQGWTVRVRVGATVSKQQEFAGLGKTLAHAEAELYDRLVGW